MAYLFDIALAVTPLLLLLLWRWRRGGRSLGPLAMAGIAGVLLMLAGAIWYGQSVSMRQGTEYRPAQLAPDGTIRPGAAEPRR